MATTWRLAFEDLERKAPGARAAAAAGGLRAKAIPLRLLLRPRPGLAGRLGEDVAPVLVPLLEDERLAGDAIAALRRYSLISPPPAGAVSVHRLVRRSPRTQMPNGRPAIAAGRLRADRGRPRHPRLPITWPTYPALVQTPRLFLT